MSPQANIPAEVRPELCQVALDAQKACLDLFDAIEAGDLAGAALAHMRLIAKTNEAGQTLRIYAALELAGLEAALGVTFGKRR